MCGIILEVPVIMSADQIKENITGTKVLEINLLKRSRNRENVTGCLVILHYQARCTLDMYYGFRPHIPLLVRCFKCNKYGHGVAVR